MHQSPLLSSGFSLLALLQRYESLCASLSSVIGSNVIGGVLVRLTEKIPTATIGVVVDVSHETVV